MTDDLVRVAIRDCRVNLKIGHYTSEMHTTQPVVIAVKCEGSLDRRYDDIAENNLANVINYRPIHDFICTQLSDMGHIYFLESAAEKIISFCFQDRRVQKVWVKLDKISVFPDGTVGGIEMQRTRK